MTELTFRDGSVQRSRGTQGTLPNVTPGGFARGDGRTTRSSPKPLIEAIT